MTVWGVTGGVLGALAVAAAAACAGDGSSSATTTNQRATTTSDATTTSTTAPQRMASTTTTAFDPASVEGQVEAVYLRSWDVYADAVYNLQLDEAALAEVYAGESLDGKLREISGRVRDGRAARVRVDHEYDVIIIDEFTAQVVDRFTNHQVLIDPDTKEPVEADPNEVLIFNFRLERGADGAWRVAFIERVNL